MPKRGFHTTLSQKLGGILRPSNSSLPRIQSSRQSTDSQSANTYVGDDIADTLRKLYDSAGDFTPLQDAAQFILSYLDALKVGIWTLDMLRKGTKITVNKPIADKPQYECLLTEVQALNGVLQQRLKASAPGQLSECAMNLALSIKYQAEYLDLQEGYGPKSYSSSSNSTEERAGVNLEPIICLMQQLRTEMKMSIDYVSNDSSAGVRIEHLSPVKLAYHNSALLNRQLCARGTCIWTLSELSSWATNPDFTNVYWLTGSLGTGKTTIAATFSDKLEREKRLAASFFCSQVSLESRQVNRVIPTIAYQLACYSAMFRCALSKALYRDSSIGSKDLTFQFERLLKDPLREVNGMIPKNLVVVLDALDECEDAAGLKLLLSLLVQESGGLPVKFFLTTRPVAVIDYQATGRVAVSSTTLRFHQLERSLVQEEVKIYLEQELSEVPLATSQVEHLTHRSGHFFIYAVTFVRFIRHFMRSTSLWSLLQSFFTTTTEPTGKYANIDELYELALQLALEQVENQGPAGLQHLRLVLMAIVCAQEPVDVSTIAELTGIWDREMVLHLLHLLLPLLTTSSNGLVKIVHSSLLDFIFNKSASGPFFCDLADYHQHITRQCFVIMKSQLRFNICDLDSSHKADELVNNLADRARLKISTSLSYSCRYWGYHLHLSQWSGDLQEALYEFLCIRLLFWMEVVNLKGLIAVGPDILLKAQQWLKSAIFSDIRHSRSLDDAYKFVRLFATSPVSRSTPHIYISALLFWPHSGFVSKTYGGYIRHLVKAGDSELEGRIAAVASWEFGSKARSIAYSYDETRVAFGCESGMVEVWDLHDSVLPTGPMQGHINKAASIICRYHSSSIGNVDSDTVCPIALAPRGDLIASASDHTIQVRPLDGGRCSISLLEGHSDQVLSIAFSPDGHLIASGSRDCNVRVWNSLNKEPISGPLEGHYRPVSSVIFSPGGQRIASSSWDHTIRVWDPYKGTLIAGPFVGHISSINSVSFSPNGAYLVSGSSDGDIGIWDARNGLAMIGTGGGTFPGHTGSINSAVFSHDGNYIISSSKDQAIRMWDASSGLLVNSPFYALAESMTSLSISPGGKHIVCSDDHSVWLWRFSDTRRVNSKEGSMAPAHRVTRSTGNSSKTPVGDWKIRSDGWIIAEDSSLLLWVPPTVRGSLSSPGSESICKLISCAGTLEVNLDNLPLGEYWYNCYKPN